jgi:hypothetical protein
MKDIHLAPDEFDFAFQNNQVQLPASPIQRGSDHDNDRIEHST